MSVRVRTCLIFLLIFFRLVSSQYDDIWYKTSTLYQVYPRSFKDSNNDGIGDLQGIIDKFDLFTDAGITAFWLSPIFESPQVDQGYDVSNYTKVDPSYGTNEDLKRLIDLAHKNDIKVLLDFIPNHTSDQIAWFNKSINRENGFDDMYVWVDGVKDANGNMQPPNNWASVFDGSAWEWNEKRQQFFLHQFTTKQPDLNYRSENMLKTLKEIMIFWLDQGIDGFRVDAVPYLIEDDQLRNEPLITDGEDCKDVTNTSFKWNCLEHKYTKDMMGSIEAVYNFRTLVDDYSKEKGDFQRIIITEAYTERDTVLLYYGSEDGTRLGAHYTFNFDFISYLNYNSSGKDFADIINWWQTNLNTSMIRNWVMGNHDNHRVATRLGHTDAYNMLLVGFLPGVSVTYQGEEIGMEDGKVNCTQGKDPKADCSNFDQVSRDFERTPFHWDNTTNAGFNDGNKTWLPVSEKYLTNNLAAQNVTGLKSHYNLYKKFVKFHKKLAALSEISEYKEATSKLSNSDNPNVLISYRMFNSDCRHEDPYVFLFNTGRVNNERVNLNKIANGAEFYRIEVTGANSLYNEEDVIHASNTLKLLPEESIIIKALCYSSEPVSRARGLSLNSLLVGLVVLLSVFWRW